jgi:predicted dehydrogenase
MERNRRWLEGQAWTTADLRLYETYQEMLEKESLELVVVALPYARNAFAVAAAAKAGVNILSEKPVAVTLADLDIVEEAVKRSGVRLSAMFAMRYSPNIFTVRETVRKGSIGRPCLARAQKSYKWGDDRPWFYRDKDIYGSTILWVGIHAVDYVRWATGLEVRMVSGFHSNLAHPGYEGVQDAAVLSLGLDGGASASITMDFLRPDTAPTHGDDRLRIAGSEGTVETIGEPATITLLRREQNPSSPGLAIPPQSLFADLVSELRGEGTHLIGPDEAVRVTRICIVATEAAETRRVLPV